VVGKMTASSFRPEPPLLMEICSYVPGIILNLLPPDGSVVAGPANKPLNIYKSLVKDGQLFVELKWMMVERSLRKILILGERILLRRGYPMENKGSMLAYLVILVIFVTLCATDAATITVEPGQRIQPAIDAASPGDIVNVEAGVYRENLNITKRIMLVGIEKPLVDGGAAGNAITLRANGVHITGFGIENSRTAGIAVFSNGSLIENNNISGCNDGIHLENSHNNSIRGNSIDRNTNGMTIYRSHKNFITENNISKNRIGDGSDCGIYMAYSNTNTISNNLVEDNGDCSICILSSSSNLLIGNNISSNRWYGLSLGEFSNNNLIIGNLVQNNKYSGIYLENSRENTIKGNRPEENGNGIYLSCNSNNNTVTGNFVSKNDRGIHLAFHSSNNTITKNNAINNEFGIYITFSSGWNKIFDNSLINNDYNAYDMGLKNQWDNGSVGNYYSDMGSKYYIPGGGGVDRHPMPPPIGDDFG
jgi:parallel beta-helix repeat protein